MPGLFSNGRPWEVCRHPVNEFVANFIGRANFVDGEVVRVEGDRLVMRAEVYPEGREITISFHKDAVYCLPK